jgi:hypothetical protein
MEEVKLHWNFIEKKWNLVEIGTIIPEVNYSRKYVFPAELHFIDPRKSRLVRLAWMIHNFFEKLNLKKTKKINSDLSIFENPKIGEPWQLKF